MPDNRSATIIRVVKNRDNPYVVIHQGVFTDPRLSWKAKGLMGYLLSRPDDWTIQVRDLVRRSRDGRDSVYAGLAELKAAGYVEERIVRAPNGRIQGYEYRVYEQPQAAPAPPDPADPARPAPTATASGFSGSGCSGSGNAGPLLNMDFTKYGEDNNNSPPAPPPEAALSGRLGPATVVVPSSTGSEPPTPRETTQRQTTPHTLEGEGAAPPRRPLPLPDPDARALANRLHEVGLPMRLAHRLVVQDRAQCAHVLAWLDACPGAERPANPAGWVRRAIEDRWVQPPSWVRAQAAQAQAAARAQAAAAAQAAQRAAELAAARQREHAIAAARAWWSQLSESHRTWLWAHLIPALQAEGLPGILLEALQRIRGLDPADPGIRWLEAAREYAMRHPVGAQGTW